MYEQEKGLAGQVDCSQFEQIDVQPGLLWSPSTLYGESPILEDGSVMMVALGLEVMKRTPIHTCSRFNHHVREVVILAGTVTLVFTWSLSGE